MNYYSAKPFSHWDMEDMAKGFYKLADFDKTVFQISPRDFWSRFENLISYYELERVREAMGYSMDALHNEEYTKNEVFVPIPASKKRIFITYASSSMAKISSKSIEHLQYIMVFYNFLHRKGQTSVIITSTTRTPQRQAEIVFDNVAYGRGAATSMYSGNSGIFVESMLREAKATREEIVAEIKQGIKTRTYTTFRHVDDPNITADIGVNVSNIWAKEPDFKNVLRKVKTAGKFLDNRTLIHGEGRELHAHHLVLFH